MKIQQVITEATKKQRLESMVSELNIANYTVNKNGTVNVDGDLTISWGYKDEWPKLHSVSGDFIWKHPAKNDSYDSLPKQVGGDCTIVINFPLTTSKLPRNSGNGTLTMLPKYPETRGADMIVDDDTLNTWAGYKTWSYIVGGFEHLPTPWKTQNAYIKSDNLVNMPADIQCENFQLFVTSPDTLKGIHRVFRAVKATSGAQAEFPENSPILGLLRIFKGQWLTVTIQPPVERNGQFNMNLRGLISKASRESTDIFEVQDKMIDAGYGAYAKL